MPDLAIDPARDDPPERLLERYIAGDDGAFGQLVARYEDKLFAYLARMVGDAHLAEDVFQQTFIKVAANAAAYDGRASFSTWLYRIARNAALDALRRRARRPEELSARSEGILAESPARTEPPLDRLSREEMAERVREALLRIPDAQREAFLLKEEGDMDFNEIGVVLGCGRETAKSRFRLAVTKLRQLLGVDGNAERGGGHGG